MRRRPGDAVERALDGKAGGSRRRRCSGSGEEHKLKPHQVRSFKFSKDPQLVEKIVDVVGLYLDPPRRRSVMCVDEETPTQ